MQNGPFIDCLPMKHSMIFNSSVKLPEGNYWLSFEKKKPKLRPEAIAARPCNYFKGRIHLYIHHHSDATGEVVAIHPA